MPRTVAQGPNTGFAAYERNYRDNSLPPQALSSKNFRYAYDEFRNKPIAQTVNGGAASGATAAQNQLNTGSFFNYPIEYFILGAGQTITVPLLDPTVGGLDVSLDNVDDEGAEYVFGAPVSALSSRGRFAFTIQTDRAFFARLKLYVADVSGTDALYFGWRKGGAIANADPLAYTDYAAFAILTAADPAVISTSTRLNSGSAVDTDTGQTLADAVAKTFEVRVLGDGTAIFLLNGVRKGQSGFVFDSGDVVIPYFRYLNSSDVAGKVVWQTLEIGYVKE